MNSMEGGNELSAVAQQSGLEPTKVERLLSNFSDSYQNARELSQGAADLVVTEESQTELMKEARTKRLALKNIRVDVENTRKSLKEQSLREGKAIDGMSNIIKALIVPIEEHLERQEKFAEMREAERKATRHAERLEKLSQYVPNVGLYSLEDMNDEVFNTLLADSKTSFEAKKAAEAQAEADRMAREKAEAEENERIRLENIKLKEEADKREAQEAVERKKAEQTRLAEQKKLDDERKAMEKEAAAIRAEAEKKLAEERAIRAEMEAKVKAEAEAKQLQELADEAAKRKALLAPDKEKLLAFADQLDLIEMPNVSNREAGKVLDETTDFLDRIIKNLRNKAKEL